MSYVYKLGGTSQCKTGYDKLINIIKNSDNNTYIVLSAVSNVTNNLVKFTETKDIQFIMNAIQLNRKLISELDIDPLFFDYISSDLLTISKKYVESFDMSDIYVKSEIIGYGEVMSTNILHMYFILNNINNHLLDSYDYITSKKEIYQCNTQTEFYCKEDINIKMRNQIGEVKVFILQGFIGSTPSGKTIILGRGGSDTTCALVAKAIGAKVYEVWTDVDGIYTGDPRIFKNSFLIKEIDYDLCQELSAMGAKVMHPLSIKPCADVDIPIIVKNTFSDSTGTKISNEKSNETFYAIQKSQTVFKIKSLDMWNSYGFITDIFRRFSENRIDINIVTTSQFSISATTSETNIYKLKEINDILKERYEVDMINDCTIFSIVRRNIKDILHKLNFNIIEPEIIHISDNDMTLNLVIKNFDLDKIFQMIKY
jgi:diaminopimelate decarboxylase/aspartate kinase